MNHTTPIQLPLAHTTHRQITNAAGHVVIEIQSGGCASLEEANALQDLVVTACNAHGTLVEFFDASSSMMSTLGHEDATAQDEHKAEERFDRANAAARKIAEMWRSASPVVSHPYLDATPTGPTIAELQDAGALAKPDSIEGKLTVEQNGSATHSDIYNADGFAIAGNVLHANAQRIAACWNACIGWSIGYLEHPDNPGFMKRMIQIGDSQFVILGQVRDVLAEQQQLRTQADDLIAITTRQTQELTAAHALQAQLVKALQQILDINCPITGNPSREQLIEHWEYEKTVGRGEADAQLFALNTLTAAGAA